MTTLANFTSVTPGKPNRYEFSGFTGDRAA